MSDTTLCTRNFNSQSACEVTPKLNLRETWRRWRRNSQSRKQLAEMSNHLLKDVGITRSQALQEISKPFWKD